MLFSIIILLLVLAVVMYQAMQGIFSALIMAVLTVCCAAAAFGTFEWVAVNWIAPYWRGDYAAPVALAATFGVPLIILRVISDQLIRRSCLLPGWFDRLGGGICGFVTSMVLVGVMATAVQMVPFHNGSILGYSRVAFHPREKKEGNPDPTPPTPDAPESNLWLSPDRFAVATAGILSDGLFSARRSFLGENPDMIQAIGWLNMAPAAATRYAPPGSISIVRTKAVAIVYKRIPPPARSEERATYEPIYPKQGHEYQMIRVRLDRKARGDGKQHIFTLRQFRLLGNARDSERASQYFPIAIQQDVDESPNRHIRIEKNGRWGDWTVTERAYEPRDGNKGEVEVVFELPEGFRPSYVEYKRAARVPVSFDAANTSAGASAPRRREARTVTDDDAEHPKSERGGNVRAVATSKGGSHFGSEMPVTLRTYRRLKNAELHRGSLSDGHLVAFLDEQATGTGRPVKRFDVPSDKRLLHLSISALTARSMFGKAIAQAVKTVQNYSVLDSNGRQYHVAGLYATANVDGRRVFEVQYFSDPVGVIGGLGRFDKIRDKHLKTDYEYTLLFLVDPGAKIVTFTSGGSASRREDLSGEDLVAPK